MTDFAKVAKLDEALERRMDRVRETTAPLYRSVRGRLEALASAVLLRVGDDHFALTAAHAVDGSKADQLFLGSQREPVLLNGKKTTTQLPRSGSRLDDRLDVAVLSLTPEVAAQFAEKEFLAVAETMSDGPLPVDDYYLLAGFPLSMQKVRQERGSIDAYLYPLVALSLDAPVYSSASFTQETHLLLGFKKQDTWRRDVGKKTAPNPTGMSGCGVWHLVGHESAVPEKPRLVAIATEWHTKAGKYIAATRLSVAFDGLRSVRPDLAPALPRIA